MRFKQNFSLYPRKTKNGIIWYYRTYDDKGKRTTGTSTGCSSKIKAQIFCENLYKQGLLAVLEVSEKPLGIIIKDYFSPGNPWYQNKVTEGNEIANSTLLSYTKNLNNYIYPFFKDIKVKNCTLAKLKEFRNYLTEQNLKISTINLIITHLKLLFADLTMNEVFKINPALNLKTISTNTESKVDAFTIDELKLILKPENFVNQNNDEYELYLLFLTCSLTGMRIDEALGLKVENIYPDHIDCKLQMEQNLKIVKNVKTKEPRIIPIIPELYEKLIKNAKKSGFIFIASYAYCRYYFNKAKKKFLSKERLEKGTLHIHSLRHFYNTYLLAENIAGIKVDAIIGHADKEHTMQRIYTNFKPEHFKEVEAANKKLWNEIAKY